MNLPKQLINLLGFVVVIAVLAIGGALVAAPLYSQSLNTDADTARVGQTNAQYDAQVQSLLAAQKELPRTKNEVAALRTQLSSAADRDDVFELVSAAVATADATVTSVSAGDIVAFAAPAADDAEAAAAPTTDAPATDASADAAAAASSPADTAGPTTTAAGTDDDGRSQVPFTITVDTGSPEDAAEFLDGLREGPRLVAITHSALSQSSGADDAASYTLTVDALAFISPAE